MPWMVVGLGNPGPQYEFSPHNMGFLVADRFAERNGIRISRPEARSLVGTGEVAGDRIVVVKPQTFMNESGSAVERLFEKYEMGPANLLLVYDELALPWKHLRVRPKGSAAGHNGVSSVIRHLGTDGFARIRVGVHPGHPLDSGKDFLLSPMRRDWKKDLDELCDLASQAAESVITEGVEKAMAKFNRRAQGLTEEDQ